MERNEFTDFLQNEFASGMYTHHQKSVILDAPASIGDGQRRLMAFVGGLDLTGGRWDTPEHHLYSTLVNEHLGDFRNSNAKSVPPEEGYEWSRDCVAMIFKKPLFEVAYFIEVSTFAYDRAHDIF
jgi:hypothetical protein